MGGGDGDMEVPHHHHHHPTIFFKLSPIKTDAPHMGHTPHLKVKPPSEKQPPPIWNMKLSFRKWFPEKSTIINLKSS